MGRQAINQLKKNNAKKKKKNVFSKIKIFLKIIH